MKGLTGKETTDPVNSYVSCRTYGRIFKRKPSSEKREGGRWGENQKKNGPITQSVGLGKSEMIY